MLQYAFSFVFLGFDCFDKPKQAGVFT